MNTDARPSYSPGLEGVVAGETAICWVDPDAGLLSFDAFSGDRRVYGADDWIG